MAASVADLDETLTCLRDKDLSVRMTVYPAESCCTFQWLELAIYLVLAGALGGFAFWQNRRG
jgi:hypothetical protein